MRDLNAIVQRLTEDEPVSRLAIWSLKFSRLSLLLAGLAVIAAHAHGTLARFFAIVTFSSGRGPDSGVGLFIFLAALAAAVLTVLTAAGAAASIWRKGRRGVRKILLALALLTLFLPYPAWHIYQAGNPPWLADISTDLEDPPAFSATPATAQARGWTPGAYSPAHKLEQAAAYPDAKTISVDMELDEAFTAVREAVKTLNWTILEEVRPGGPKRPDGHIEALAHTAALNLPVAISIRVRRGEDDTRVDMRAVTRYLPNDLGGGEALVGKLSDELESKDDDSE